MNKNVLVRAFARSMAAHDGKEVNEGYLIEAGSILSNSGIYDVIARLESEIERHEDARAETIRQNRELRNKLDELQRNS